MQTIKTTDCWTLKEGTDLTDPRTIVLPMSCLEHQKNMVVVNTGELMKIVYKAFEAGQIYGMDLFRSQVARGIPAVCSEIISGPDLFQYIHAMKFVKT